MRGNLGMFVKPLKNPGPMLGLGPDYDPGVPEAGMIGRVGWLAPDGTYYPSGSGGDGDYEAGHGPMADRIMYAFYREVLDANSWGYSVTMGEDGIGNIQLYLIRHGWIRTDYGEEWLMTEDPTPEQIRTLYKLMGNRPRFNLRVGQALLNKYVSYLVLDK